MTGKPQPNLPHHLAIIMDGNGRWAEARGQARSVGHRHGVERAQDIVAHVRERGIPWLTLYAFSAENWGRPRQEVHFLMTLMEQFIDKNLARLHAENVRVRILGERAALPRTICGRLARTEALTKNNCGLQLQISFNYSGQQEIVSAARKLAEEVRSQTCEPAEIDVPRFQAALYASDMPPCDLLIRTGGEYRLSNFLLWQSAYAELYFDPLLWPAFDRQALDRALSDYARRTRRFGGLAKRFESQIEAQAESAWPRSADGVKRL